MGAPILVGTPRGKTYLGTFTTLDALYKAARKHLKENKDRDKEGYSWVKTGKVIL